MDGVWSSDKIGRSHFAWGMFAHGLKSLAIFALCQEAIDGAIDFWGCAHVDKSYRRRLMACFVLRLYTYNAVCLAFISCDCDQSLKEKTSSHREKSSHLNERVSLKIENLVQRAKLWKMMYCFYYFNYHLTNLAIDQVRYYSIQTF